jgi:hypothetical protein
VFSGKAVDCAWWFVGGFFFASLGDEVLSGSNSQPSRNFLVVHINDWKCLRPRREKETFRQKSLVSEIFRPEKFTFLN